MAGDLRALAGILVVLTCACGESPSADSPLAPKDIEGTDQPSPTSATALAQVAGPQVRQAPQESSVEEQPPLRVVVPDAVPGALEVWLLDVATYDPAEYKSARRAAASSRSWDLVERFASRIATTEVAQAGEATLVVAHQNRRNTIIVRAGERVGRRKVARGRDGTLVVRLNEVWRRSTTVTVVDHAGAPVPGIEVGIASPATIAGLRAADRAVDVPATQFSDPNGNASVLMVGEGRAFALPPGVGFVAAPESDPLRVELPPSGAVTIRVSGVAGEGEVQLRFNDWGDQVARATWNADTGRADFSWVPLGVRFVASAQEGERATGELEFEGPITVGELREVVLELVPRPVLRARLVDTSGNARGDVLVAVHDPWLRPIGRVRSDAEGVVAISVTDDAISEATLGRLLFEVTSSGFKSPVWGAPTPGAAIITDEGVDVGAVTLRAIPMAATGRVVSSSGEPVAGATVVAFTSYGEGGPLGIGGGGGRRPDAKTRTDRLGQYELEYRPLFVDEEFELAARALGFGESAAAPVAYGVAGHDIVLSAEGALEVDVSRLPPEVRADLVIMLHEPGGIGAKRAHATRKQRFARLRPGSYSLTVEDNIGEIARIEELVVPPGGECLDPRLTPLRLPHEFRVRHVHVLDYFGVPIEGAWLDLTDLDARDRTRTKLSVGPDGALTIVEYLGRRTRATIAAPDRRSQDAAGVADGETVTLAPALSLEIRLVGAEAPPTGHIVYVRRTEPGLPGADLGEYKRVGVDGRFTIRLPSPGEFAIGSYYKAAVDSPWQRARFKVTAETTSVDVAPPPPLDEDDL